MSQEQLICIFSLSRSDPHFRYAVSIKPAVDWLNSKRDKSCAYYFRQKTPKKGLSSGSTILFSFDGQIFGQAIVKEGIRRLSSEQKECLNEMELSADYQYYISFEPSSIEIFRFHPTKRELEESIDDLRFSQLYTYITLLQYSQILAIARRK